MLDSILRKFCKGKQEFIINVTAFNKKQINPHVDIKDRIQIQD